MSPLGCGHLGPQGLNWQDLSRGPLHIATNPKYISCGPHGFREEDFLSFSHYKSMGANDPRGRGQFGSQGRSWQNLCRSTNHCYILYLLALGIMVSKKKIFEGSLAIYLYINICPPPPHPECGQFGALGLDWQDLCRGPLKLLHTKYISCGSHCFRDKDFFKFSHYKSMGSNDHRGVANLDRRSVVGRIYAGDH